LYVHKTAPSQWIKAGDLVTFTINFGNQVRRGDDWTKASTTLTDTLLVGMTYVASTVQWCVDEDCPYIIPDIQDSKLIFDTYQQDEGWWNNIFLTVKISEQAEFGDTFGNFVEFYSKCSVEDPEGDYSNNSDTFTVTVESIDIYLPFLVHIK
jgi:uncharacterized repeat protein (TIGR01451 family)